MVNALNASNDPNLSRLNSC